MGGRQGPLSRDGAGVHRLDGAPGRRNEGRLRRQHPLPQLLTAPHHPAGPMWQRRACSCNSTQDAPRSGRCESIMGSRTSAPKTPWLLHPLISSPLACCLPERPRESLWCLSALTDTETRRRGSSLQGWPRVPRLNVDSCLSLDPSTPAHIRVCMCPGQHRAAAAPSSPDQ